MLTPLNDVIKYKDNQPPLPSYFANAYAFFVVS
nr:MAG TPA_asm: hypothetical protein [Caudoviricetes sp.]